MTRARLSDRAAIILWLLVPAPAIASAQRGVARTVAPPRIVIAQPASPMGSSLGARMGPGTQVGPRGVWGVAERATIGRTYQPSFNPTRPMMTERSWPRWGCAGGNCRCFGRAGCNRTFVSVTPFGVPFFVPYDVPVAVPYAIPYAVPYPLLTYVPPYPPRDAGEPAAPVRRPEPGHSKMVVIDSGSDLGGGRVTVEQVSDSLLRLTWLPSPQPIREARLFVADSAQRPLRTQRVDATTPSALVEIHDLVGKIAYAGVSVVMTHGTILTTLVPYPAKTHRGPLPPPR